MDDENHTKIIGEFDKEYGIEELITQSDANLFFKDLVKLGISYAGLFYKDCSLYVESDPQKRPFDHFDFTSIDSTHCCISERIMVYPVFHQFDILTYLLIEFPDGAGSMTMENNVLMDFFAHIIHQIVGSRYKTLMTSGLHSQVVHESYEEIRLKNELLEKSEKKYRILAQSLEEEVARKGDEIKEAQTQLMHQEKLASIGQLAAGVAHEINNPMGFISSNLRSLKEYVHDLSSALELYIRIQKVLTEKGIMTEKILAPFKTDILAIDKLDINYLLEDIPTLIAESMEGAERINKIVSDLKDFAHPGEETPSYADVIECIDSTMNMVWNELKYKATVTRSFEPVPYILCYPRQLNQVFMNLLVNAVQAIDTKGNIEIITRDKKDWVEILIRDTGQGIAENILPKIFDPFFTTKHVGKGTGLGLNLVYNIIRKHKGNIHVSSKVGKGTTFTIRLPVHGNEKKHLKGQ